MEVKDGTTTQAGVTPNPVVTGTPTFTQEQVDKMVRDARTSVMADIGRQRAEAEKALKAATAAQERLSKLEAERMEAELEAAKDQPDKIRLIRESQRRKALESKLEQAETELNEHKVRLTELTQKETESRKSQISREIATRLNVDPGTLAKLAKFTDGTAEAIEDIANNLPKLNTMNTFKPDSNRTSGGTSQTVMDVKKDYIAGKINAVQRAEKLRALGETP